MVIAAGVLRDLFVTAVAVKSPGRRHSLPSRLTISAHIVFEPASIRKQPIRMTSGFCGTVFAHCLAVFHTEWFPGNVNWAAFMFALGRECTKKQQCLIAVSSSLS